MHRTLALITAAALTAVAGCSGSRSATPTDPTLKAVGAGGTGAYIEKLKPGVPYLIPVRDVCATNGPVTITSVRPYGGDNMHIVAWGVRRRTVHTPWNSLDNAGGIRGLPTMFPGFGHKPVTVPCGPSTRTSSPHWAVEDMDVSASFTGTRGTMRGLEIRYDDGRVARSQFDLALCSTKTCKPASA